MKIKVDYEPVSGNISVNGLIFWIGSNLQFDDAENNSSGSAIVTAPESDVVKLSNNGMTSEDLISLRKAGVI